MVDKHGLKIVNLKNASGVTKNYGYYSDHHDQIIYNIDTGIISIYEHIGSGSYTVSDDPHDICVGHTRKHLTMQELADMVLAAYADYLFYRDEEFLPNGKSIFDPQIDKIRYKIRWDC